MKLLYTSKTRLFLMSLLFSLAAPGLATATPFPEPGDPIAGAKVWADTCSRCHNARNPSDLRDDQWISTAFHMRMRAGLTGQQTRDVLTFMQDSNVPINIKPMVFEGNSVAPVVAQSSLSGVDVYNQTCIACHGANGKGTVPGAPDLTDAKGVLSQTDEVLLEHIKFGFKSPGSAMAMPPKGGNKNLTDADINAVIQYMQEQFN